MKKIAKLFLLIMSGILVLGACDNHQEVTELNFEDLKEMSEQRLATPVVIDEDTNFLDMDPEEKEAAYQALDKIITSQENDFTATSFSQIQLLDSEESYLDLVKASQDKGKIIYFGFDECPFCQAFLPKFNHLAKEFGETIYYYDVKERKQDANFESIINQFDIETVPNAFMIKEGEAVQQVNHHTSMKVLEEFMRIIAQE